MAADRDVTGQTPPRHQPAGTPECLRYAVAALLHLDPADVPRFNLCPDGWWDALRRWARRYGGDFHPLRPVGGTVRVLLEPPHPAAVLAAGPSPRNPHRRHVVVTDPDLRLLHDPHPTGPGLGLVDEVYVWVGPYDPPPSVAALG